MPVIPIQSGALSDLVFHEIDPSVGYARRVINLADNDVEIPMGTVVFREATASQEAPYAVADAEDLVDGDEGTDPADVDLAVVFGDQYGCKGVFTTAATGQTKAVAYVRGEVMLKDYLLMESLGIDDRGDPSYQALKSLLEKQGIIIENTIGG